MSKIHLPNNKETLVIFGVVSIFITMVVMNVMVLVPRVVAVYTQKPKENLTEPLDVKTVNQAIDEITTKK